MGPNHIDSRLGAQCTPQIRPLIWDPHSGGTPNPGVPPGLGVLSRACRGLVEDPQSGGTPQIGDPRQALDKPMGPFPMRST